jgi:hypothetical protein
VTEVAFTLAPDGTVSQVALTPALPAALATCVAGTLRQVRFVCPASGQTSELRARLTLEPRPGR